MIFLAQFRKILFFLLKFFKHFKADFARIIFCIKYKPIVILIQVNQMRFMINIFLSIVLPEKNLTNSSS